MFVREIAAPVSDLKGAGPTVAARLARLGVFSGADLLLLAPRDYEDRTARRLLSEFGSGVVNCRVTVVEHDWFGYGRMRTLKVWVEDENGTRAALVCFNRSFLERSYPVGAVLKLYGRFEYRFSELQSSSFDADPIADPDGAADAPDGVRPVYPLTEGLGQATVRKLAGRALSRWGIVDDEIPPSIRERRGLLRKADALRSLHAPLAPSDAAAARRTLAYEELFYLQVMIARRAAARRDVERPRSAPPDGLARALKERLSFELTPDQESAIAEIVADMSGPWPMARLLQGDVGSGKTLVAFFSALYAIAGGGQAALMAPTELLARQHADTAARLLEPLGVRLAYLSGNVADAARRPLLAALARGDVDLAVGTHALFSDDVAFKDLRLVVVDEQQRFGVLQRLAMGAKGRKPDMLMMTATPIPRTLALTAYGDLSVSTIKTMPAGRLPIITHLAKDGNEAKVYEFVRRELAAGRRAYFVYPLVDRSDKLALKDAEAMFARLSGDVFPEFRGGLIHARLPEETKRATMADFAAGRLSFVVATSVVEVGVDVPEATCMVIEHAERFGLAALHQLRGRVGRSSLQSYCFLVWSDRQGEGSASLSEDGKRRVLAMKATTDGFEIAEEDLRIRGPGEITGTTQAGALRLSFADPIRDADLLEAASIDAVGLLKSDPGLVGQEGSIVRAVIERASPFSERTAATG
ncbi:MAG: ATP-dependent DNA helicase RecG [Spirochaetae bacterium HGW-Spirochaetae-3]|nr:MAG: ATP-dependent DNA helicase RecG [Spirochaetae bacterium HGW-Spirochaetae-3]